MPLLAAKQGGYTCEEIDQRAAFAMLVLAAGFGDEKPECHLAAGARALQNTIVEAWLDSVNTPIGHPMINVRDIESGKVRATRELFGADYSGWVIVGITSCSAASIPIADRAFFE